MRVSSLQVLSTRASTLARRVHTQQALPHLPGFTFTKVLRPSTSPTTTRPLPLLFSTKRYQTSTTQPPKTMSTDTTNRYKLVFYAPISDLEKCKEAVFSTGAGTFPGGKYSKCAFQTTGTGQFLPSENANPAIGGAGALEKVEEAKVEVLCFEREVMRRAVEDLVKAHPYEEVAYEVYKVEDI